MGTEPDDVLQRALDQARTARDRLRELRAEVEELTRARDAAIRELSALGRSYDAIAADAGVTRARVGQIVNAVVRRS